MPSLKDVAMKYFSGGLTSSDMVQSTSVVELSDDNQLYYERLGLQSGADTCQDDVVLAYRKLVRTAHPDRGGDPMVFYEINKAYAVLRDPSSRELYDKYGERWVDMRDMDEEKK
eukprot:CAMPEP_0197858134 /NCGR_PEP_ID=MMETSP1438-20131217/31720_1 /TAXON_ID=1461541 /ORGANISM="Pterosperma sp., Strain CCMP1384" /LENGTH=113 /DNA_ID=CAMNT_0043474197 /DNA_START=113 /DNA_END=454 /DNA_ORIENTATION=-